MFYCLCGSIIFMVIIMICVLSELGKYIDDDGNQILTTQYLRGMYIEDIIDGSYNNVRNGVIESASKGKTHGVFTIMCIRSSDPNGARKNYYGDDNSYSCENYDGYQEWWGRYISRNGGEIIPKNNIQSKQIKMRIIEKIQNTFPDSNITKVYKNCCDTYNINW
jgi:hypothetical protein